MKIAFTSCMSTQVFAEQPVWDQIAQAQPDVLLLLGDSIYMDAYTYLRGYTHPSRLSDEAFAQRMHERYSALLAQPQFRSLVQSLPAGAVYSIWDDHDFLWNNACGAQEQAQHAEKIRLSTAFQRVFRACLAQGAAGLDRFPTSPASPEFHHPDEPPLATPSYTLSDRERIHLHLLDGRTYRTSPCAWRSKPRRMLGQTQKDQIEQQIAQCGAGLHLLASGSTAKDWKDYPEDWAWLHDLAQKHELLLVSGDIHLNRSEYHQRATPTSTQGSSQVSSQGFYEVTSSGAAVRYALSLGFAQQNYGLLQVDGASVQAQFFHFGQEQKSKAIKQTRSALPQGL